MSKAPAAEIFSSRCPRPTTIRPRRADGRSAQELLLRSPIAAASAAVPDEPATPCPATQCIARPLWPITLTSGTLASPLIGFGALVLDIPTFPRRDDELWQLLHRMRAHKNRVFESCSVVYHGAEAHQRCADTA